VDRQGILEFTGAGVEVLAQGDKRVLLFLGFGGGHIGSLPILGTLDTLGSLNYFGTLATHGSLLATGTLGWSGSLNAFGTLFQFGSFS
jgi:hypothetical protein